LNGIEFKSLIEGNLSLTQYIILQQSKRSSVKVERKLKVEKHLKVEKKLQLVAQHCVCKLQSFVHPHKQHQDLLPKVEPSSTSCNMLLQLATLKFVARQVACGGGNTGNKALQLAKQQYCLTSCTEMLSALLGL